jgi:hypothetical protein
VPGLATEVRAFLSSTFLDLRELREEVRRRLGEIFGAHLITMETFGSDEAEPKITSVRRVRECDLFIGIYARRYGTVDPDTGKSITELDLEEAERARSAGSIAGILLYVLDDQAPWPAKYDDTDPAQIEKLARLKERIRQYTVTRFSVDRLAISHHPGRTRENSATSWCVVRPYSRCLPAGTEATHATHRDGVPDECGSAASVRAGI